MLRRQLENENTDAASEAAEACARSPSNRTKPWPRPPWKSCPDQVKDSLHAYQISKRGNSLRVMAEAVRWGKRGARINASSPGIIMMPLARDERTGPRGDGYRRMIELSAALLMGSDGGFITGSDFLVDGGVTAVYWFGTLAP